MFKELIKNVSQNIVGNEFKIKISIATIISESYFDRGFARNWKNYICKIINQ